LPSDVYHFGSVQNLQNKIITVRNAINYQQSRLPVGLKNFLILNFPTSGDKKGHRSGSLKAKPNTNIINKEIN
jgi:hypothetical protein